MLIDLVCLWTEWNNTNTGCGNITNGTSSFSDCINQCVITVNCNGVDWKNQSGECWLSGPWSCSRNDGTYAGITHYDFIGSSSCHSMC